MMTKTDKKALIDALNAQVEMFAKEWTQDPHHFLLEIDIQVALAAQLSALLRDRKQAFVLTCHTFFGEKTMDYSRLTCEPYVKLTTERGHMAPDIVVWDDPGDATSDTLDSGKHPILWACEIKYTSSPVAEHDIAKLKHMGNAHGVWLSLLVPPFRYGAPVPTLEVTKETSMPNMTIIRGGPTNQCHAYT
jgi:hypothetical protein